MIVLSHVDCPPSKGGQFIGLGRDGIFLYALWFEVELLF